jgi:hypothetical protein
MCADSGSSVCVTGRKLVHDVLPGNAAGRCRNTAATLIGLARHVICDKPTTADVAVVVAHEHHLRGVGTALLRQLAQIAQDNGIEHLAAVATSAEV